MTRTPQTEAMWAEFRAATGVTGDYMTCAFGDSPELIDALTDLVLTGRKQATAALLRDYEAGGEPVPQPGDHTVFVDGAGRPRGIFRTTEIRIGPIDTVDDAFARDEGEGDCSRDWWLNAHLTFFNRCAEAQGFTYDRAMDVVFERFTLVWPRQDTSAIAPRRVTGPFPCAAPIL